MSAFTIGDLVEFVQDLIDSGVEDDEQLLRRPLVLASQPGYPLQHVVKSIVRTEDDEVMVVEGDHVGYLPGYLKEQAW